MLSGLPLVKIFLTDSAQNAEVCFPLFDASVGLWFGNRVVADDRVLASVVLRARIRWMISVHTLMKEAAEVRAGTASDAAFLNIIDTVHHLIDRCRVPAFGTIAVCRSSAHYSISTFLYQQDEHVV